MSIILCPKFIVSRRRGLRSRTGLSFFYTKHHPAAGLAALVKEQLGIDASVNSTTNQVVLYCKDDTQASAVEDYLRHLDVPPVQVNVDCLILERFGDVTTDWESSIMIQNFLGEGITLGEARGSFNNSGALTNLNPAFPGASLRETERAKFGMDFGYWHNKGVPGHQIRALVDVLISHGYLKVLLNPTLETVNGQKATVTIKDYAPTQKVQLGQGNNNEVYNITEYVWVENTLTVTPFVYSDGSIGLATDIKIGSRSKPEGVVQRTIITERSINVAENRVLPGQSLIIGGMRKSEKRSVIRGIPFFKDLPLVGILFSSKDFEEKGTEIIYILTPSISSGGQDNARVVQNIRAKHADPDYKMGFKEILTEAFDSGIYGTMVEKQAADAELKRMQAELDREQAIERADTERLRANQIAAEAAAIRQKADQLKARAQKATDEAQKASEEAAAAATQTDADRQRALELQQLKDATAAQAQQAQQQAEQAALEAVQAAQKAVEAEQSLQAARQAVEDAERARQEAQKQAEEAARQRELHRQKELERQQELERQRQAEEEQQPQEQESPVQQSTEQTP
jgi:Flp pilus assembly secretin CpaC